MTKTFLIAYQITLESLTCGTCGVNFAVDASLLETWRKEKGSFHCPNGHVRGWRESEADRLKKALAVETQRRTMAESTATAEAKRAKKAEDALSRERRRVGNGVCPCCDRTFANLMRHMAAKHPEYQGPVEQKLLTDGSK